MFISYQAMTLLPFILSSMAFFTYKSHIMKSLICLEFMSLCCLLVIVSNSYWPSYFWLIVFFIFMVAEGALGLAIFMKTTNSVGRKLTSSTMKMW